MRRSVTFCCLVAVAAISLPLAARAESTPCEWLAGDFHVHTVFSHDVWDPSEGPSEEFYTYGLTARQQGEIAKSRELDFIAITDHDNDGAGTFAQDHPDHELSGWGSVPGLTWVRGYENSVEGYGGHAQMHGATHVYDDTGGPPAIAERLRTEDNGAFQINHPDDGHWHDKNGDYLFGDFAPDALEVWNIGAWFYEPPMPATNDHEFPLGMYNFFLDRGQRVAATGGSDSHWRATTAVQGVGQPTTWVCAEENSEAGIIDALRHNRTTISHQPPAYIGTFATLDADPSGGKSFTEVLGSTVPPGSSIRASVDNAPGATLRLVTGAFDDDDERIVLERRVASHDFTTVFTTDDGLPEKPRWVRAEVFYEDARDVRKSAQAVCSTFDEVHQRVDDAFDPEEDDSPLDHRNKYCENRLAMVAITSPIYFLDPSTLTYIGPSTARVGEDVTLAARLTDSSDRPLAGRDVTLTFREQTFQLETSADGVAATTLRTLGPPGSYPTVFEFAGDLSFGSARAEQVISVTSGAG